LNDPQNGSDAGALAPAVVRLAGLSRAAAADAAGKI
jgi:hypothetical protein